MGARGRVLSFVRRVLHRSAVNFYIRLWLLAGLTLPAIALFGALYKLASGASWHASLYLMYGLLFRCGA